MNLILVSLYVSKGLKGCLLFLLWSIYYKMMYICYINYSYAVNWAFNNAYNTPLK